MYELPTTIEVDNKIFHIRRRGDFRVILDCFSALQDEDLDESYRIITAAIIFYEEINSIDDAVEIQNTYLERLIKEMYHFINCGQEESIGIQKDTSLVDWDKDSQIICAAINKVSNTEIRSLEYLHWWTFMGYFMSIGQSVFSNVVSIREKLAHNKKLEKWEQDFKKSNPQYFIRKQSKEEKDVEDMIRELWNNGGNNG